MSFADITAPEDLPGSEHAVDQVVERGACEFSLVKQYVTARGDRVSGRVTGTPVYDEHGILVRLVAQVEDLNDRPGDWATLSTADRTMR